MGAVWNVSYLASEILWREGIEIGGFSDRRDSYEEILLECPRVRQQAVDRLVYVAVEGFTMVFGLVSYTTQWAHS